MELLFLAMFIYLRRIRDQKLKIAANSAANSIKASLPVTLK
jgi:hypothetical protein